MTSYGLDNRSDAFAREQSSFMVAVFTWLGIGLVISAVTAYFSGHNASTINFFEHGGYAPLIVMFIPLGIIFFLSFKMDSISATTARAVYCLFTAAQGFSLGVIFLVYTSASIIQSFLVAAGMFGVMAFWGAVTKKDLSSVGHLCSMALIGLIIASVVNLFWANSTLYWIVTYAGVLIFMGLTAYDMQKIKARNKLGNAGTDEDKKEAIWGAVALYLDLINLFLFILRIMGSRR